MLRPLPYVVAAVLTLATSQGARAEAPGDFAAAMGITTADGSVRTQASVRLSVSGIAGRGEYVKAMSSPVQAQLPELRRCFSEAMARDVGVQGKISFELEALAKGKAKASVASNETHDEVMSSCMAGVLRGTNLKAAPAGARTLVALDLSNPSAALKETMRRQERIVPVTMLAGGLAQTESSTTQGEVKFALRASAYARDGISELHQDLKARLAGLLDCRRKASRRGQSAQGTISLELTLEQGRIANVRTSQNGVSDRNASACVTKWVSKAAPAHLSPVEASLDITFSP